MTDTLQLEYLDFLRAVGYRLGKGRDESSWPESVRSLLDERVQSGYRQAVTPPAIPDSSGRPRTHRWSFMEPVATLTTVADQWEYLLPHSWAGMVGPITYATGSGYGPIGLVDESRIRRQRANTTGSGRPLEAAIRPKPLDPRVGTRHELLLWPTPNDDWVLTYRYRAQARKLSETSPIPLGGPEFGELILASCLAEAEHTVNQERGEAWSDFMAKLASMVSHDQRGMAPDSLGNMNDNASWTADRFGYHDRFATVSYNGVEIT